VAGGQAPTLEVDMGIEEVEKERNNEQTGQLFVIEGERMSHAHSLP
jgi:hypothetical protein